MKIKILFLLPPLFCYLLLHLSIDKLFYYPLIFGFVISIVNYKKNKINNIFAGIATSIILSYLVFFISYYSIGLYRPILGKYLSDDQYQELGVVLTTSVISPILLYVFYNFIFKFSKTKFTFFVIALSILLLILQSYFLYNFNKNIDFYLTNSKIYISFVIWQIIMSLSLQLILYQKELKNLFKLKS